MPGPAFKVGDRVSLHPIEPEDHEFLQRGRNHPETRVPLTDTDIRSLDDVEARLEDEEHRYLVCVADQREATDETSGEAASSVANQREATDETGDDPERAGGVAFSHVGSGDSGNLTYWVAPEHRGNGYVTEATALLLDYAFRECGFHKVTGNAFVSNEASVAVLENLGFEREGRLRESGIVDGEYEDMYQYSILADEWLQGDEPNRPSPSS
jgi:RimJ/RimL family protein N-acetyltransferase